MKILRTQLEMADTVDENLAALDRALSSEERAESTVLLAPELALTGFHRGIRAIIEDGEVAGALSRVAELADRHDATLVLGAPARSPDGEAWHNAVVVAEPGRGVRTLQAKVGLTPSEELFFAPGPETRATTLAGHRVAAVMCREILDTERLAALEGQVDVLFWPSYIQWDSGSGEDYEEAARSLARRLGCWIVQSNWATAINDAALEGLGRSLLIDPTGDITDEAPTDTAHLTAFDLPT